MTVATPFAKGHGTENDFVIIPDLGAEHDLTTSQVRLVCDRRAGLGADGILRVVPASKHPDGVAYAAEATWFMDYRNSDGSLAEMCGNGARVFACYLVREGLAEPGVIPIATRDGIKRVEVEPGARAATVELQRPTIGVSTRVGLSGEAFAATAVDVGNPHAVCVTPGSLSRLDLSKGPSFDSSVFPEGVNVEFVTPPDVDSDGLVHVGMRVYERGSGETRSCGTGAVAVAAVALASTFGASGPVTGEAEVALPGGRLRIRLAESAAFLTGPAIIVAEGTVFL